MRNLFQQTYPYQNYLFEPQSQHYLVHGDLWDFLYLKSLQFDTIFLPLTLEMGSWRWIRKNPLQVSQLLGLYHPIKPHRLNRVLRSHLVLMEFLLHATISYQNWIHHEDAEKLEQQALALVVSMIAPKYFVLIRGLLREARHWGIFTEYLQQQFPQAIITTPDIPGKGRHHQLTSPTSIAEITDALRQHIPKHHPCVLIGLSMGGMVAMNWMSRYPKGIIGGVLINTSARHQSAIFITGYAGKFIQNFLKWLFVQHLKKHQKSCT